MDGQKQERTGERIIRKDELEERTGLGRITIWRLEAQGKFPRRVYLTGRAVGWIESEVEDWIRSRERVELGANTTAHDAS